jgi:hypothetical protein
MSHGKPFSWLLAAVLLWAILASIGPTLVALIEAAIPLVIALGVVAIALRIALFHTRKW